MAPLLTFFIGLACGIVGLANSQQVKQCLCSAIRPCKAAYLDNIKPCMDTCQNHASDLGANYAQVKRCLLQHEPKVRATIQCAEGMHANSCAQRNPIMVPKRYPDTLKIAALDEINKMLRKSGLSSQAPSLVSTGKKIFSCVQSCMKKRAGDCEKKLRCGLSLPSEEILVQDAKQCAMRNGFDTATVQQLCNCLSTAGAKQLNGVCRKIKIT
ncbi:hypothetical protein Ddc_03930 [Ditylenchus destructor]|nr:hypothetical protein Ddc_03930 [Ditylenchus destructor]